MKAQQRKRTKVTVKNFEGMRVLYYLSAGWLTLPRVLRLLAPLGITPNSFLIEINHITTKAI